MLIDNAVMGVDRGAVIVAALGVVALLGACLWLWLLQRHGRRDG